MEKKKKRSDGEGGSLTVSCRSRGCNRRLFPFWASFSSTSLPKAVPWTAESDSSPQSRGLCPAVCASSLPGPLSGTCLALTLRSQWECSPAAVSQLWGEGSPPLIFIKWFSLNTKLEQVVLNYTVGKDLRLETWESLGLQGDPTSPP